VSRVSRSAAAEPGRAGRCAAPQPCLGKTLRHHVHPAPKGTFRKTTGGCGQVRVFSRSGTAPAKSRR
jgi:hypothetical protein